MINGEAVRSLGGDANSVQIVYNKIENNMTTREILFRDTRIGMLRLRADITNASISTEDSAGIQETWMQGSTNSERGWMIYRNDGLPLSAQTDRA